LRVGLILCDGNCQRDAFPFSFNFSFACFIYFYIFFPPLADAQWRFGR